MDDEVCIIQRLDVSKTGDAKKAIDEIRDAFGTSHGPSSWFAVKGTENLYTHESNIGAPDVISWALSLKDSDGKTFLWVPPRPGVTKGRLGLSFLELAALVRGKEICDRVRSKRDSKKQLLSTITFEGRSYEHLYNGIFPRVGQFILNKPNPHL